MTLATTQKLVRLTPQQDAALERVFSKTLAHRERLPSWLTPHLTPGREYSQSELVGALVAYLDSTVRAAERDEPVKETDRE